MAEKFVDKVKHFMGLDVFEEEEDEDVYPEPLYPSQEEVRGDNQPKANKVVNIHTTSQMKVVIFEPSAYDEVQNIVDNLKNRKPVIVNLETLESDVARKIFEFLNGAIYALDGSIQKVSSEIFILAPNNVEIAGNIKEELKSKGVFPWQNR
ncbi:cell division protein SepF [Tindallia californiensis]|uniref:Cell division protein SepF n=1 Tax=Tindallia californiensis TaxID=159292 RepID=A0A1H3JN29_9FIRM|nr:cell division protein SepF [Tindallia californiensis]SDY41333.1 cell division inhibitor SepF [Tindallia californiensis]